LRLTNNQKNILKYLMRVTGTTPTKIGENVGGHDRSGRLRGATWACSILKSLIAKGLVYKCDGVYYLKVSNRAIMTIIQESE